MADQFDRNTLITNRSQKDIQELHELKAKWLNGTITEEEKTKWLSGMRGAYNASDVNRVSAAMLYFEDLLNSLGYEVFLSAFLKTDWATNSTNSKPLALNWEDYFESIHTLNNLFTLPVQSKPNFVLPSSLEELNINTANNIEQMLFELDLLIATARNDLFYAGEIYSGEF